MHLSRDGKVTLLTFVVAVSVSMVLAWLVSLSSERIEFELLETLAKDELEEMQTLLARDPDSPLPQTSIVHVWLDGHWDNTLVPEVFARLPYGTHHEVDFEGDSYHILRSRIDTSDAIIAIDIDSFEAHETVVQFLLLIAVLIAPIATVMMALYLRRRLGPVVEMAKLVAELDPSERGVRLSGQFYEGEMGVIAAAFNRYQDRLDRFVERERAFSAAASHELRTPLAVVVAGSEVLMDEDLPGSLSATVTRIHSSTLQMTDLLNGLMWLAREEETPPLEDINLADVTLRVIDQYQAVLERNDLRLSTELVAAPTISLPSGHFEIVLGNLLRNAITYTPKGGDIHIIFEGKLMIFRDSGRGIESRYLDRIFDRDFRGSDSPGAGLGLYLCQRLCQYHGWRIAVTSELGQGTTVTIDMAGSSSA